MTRAYFQNFFTTVKALVNQAHANGTSSSDGYHHYEAPESELTSRYASKTAPNCYPSSPITIHSLLLPSSYHETQFAVREALCDSFNTPIALDHLRDLVSRTNVYINSRGKNLNVGVLENIARWVSKMLRLFGLGEGENSEIGWGQESQGDATFDVGSSLLSHCHHLLNRDLFFNRGKRY